MTLGAMALRGGSIAFNAYLNRTLGAVGMGFAGLVMTVFSLTVTFSSAGISLGVTRLVSEEKYPLKPVIQYGCLYGLGISIPIAIILFVFSFSIAQSWLGEPAAAFSLRILAPLLPVIAISSVFRGYFLAVRGVIRHTGILISEMILRSAVTIFLLSNIDLKDPGESCLCLVLGMCAGEFFSFFLSYLLYLPEKRRKEKGSEKGLLLALVRIAVPDAMGASFRSTLSATEHLLIPVGLQKHGSNRENALASYGIIHSMALPVVLFPSALLRSISSLMVPELASKSKNEQQTTVTQVLHLSTLYSIFCAGVLYVFADALSFNLYGTSAATSLIRAFALLIPVMFADTAVDGMLKGLDAQLYVMKINILDSMISVVSVWFLLPMGGIAAYIVIIVSCEVLNFILSVIKLRKLCAFDFNHIKSIVTPTIYTLLSAGAGIGLYLYIPSIIGLMGGLALSFVFYLGFLLLSGKIPLWITKTSKPYSANIPERSVHQKS